MQNNIFKKVGLYKVGICKVGMCAVLASGALLLSACGTPGLVKVSKSFGFLEGQPIQEVIAYYGIPDHKDVIAGKDAFVYEFHKDYLKNSIIKGNHRVRHASCQVTFEVDDKSVVTKGSVVGTDEECDVVYTRNKRQ